MLFLKNNICCIIEELAEPYPYVVRLPSLVHKISSSGGGDERVKGHHHVNFVFFTF